MNAEVTRAHEVGLVYINRKKYEEISMVRINFKEIIKKKHGWPRQLSQVRSGRPLTSEIKPLHFALSKMSQLDYVSVVVSAISAG